jgi:hypothetical protein
MRIALMTVLCVVACKGKGGSGGSGTTYKHPDPKFQIAYPADLTVRKPKLEGDGGTLAINSDKSGDYRDILFVWSKTGTPLDPELQWTRYGNEEDHTKTLENGPLPGGKGKFIVHDRSGRTFIHAVMTDQGYGVLCMASWPTDKPDNSLRDACKSLASY